MLVQRRASRRASLARLTLLVTLILSPNWSLPQPARADTLCVNIGGTGGCFGTITAALNAAADG
ncbi:MAG: hypothetical protein IT330_05500, partial [Anaerolineae bacterium]|nr:hypothetical protein [Anaerolineae bacterium]